MLTQVDYQEALEVQDACNLCGVLQTWAKVACKVIEEMRAKGKSTDWANRHPVMVLYAYKAMQLTGIPEPYEKLWLDHFSKACNQVKDGIAGKEWERGIY